MADNDSGIGRPLGAGGFYLLLAQGVLHGASGYPQIISRVPDGYAQYGHHIMKGRSDSAGGKHAELYRKEQDHHDA